MDDWILYQLSDSALPVGGFVASGGLESAFQILNIKQLDWFLQDSLHTLAYSTLPFIRSVYKNYDLKTLVQLDKEYDVFCGTNHVNKRASTTQGIAYLSLITKSFPSPLSNLILEFKQKIQRQETPGHLPICFALALIALDLPLKKTEFMFLYLHVRTIVSSAIRLSLIGPYQGQQIIYQSKGLVEEALKVKGQEPNEAFQTSPIVDILQGSHDRLYTRIFNS